MKIKYYIYILLACYLATLLRLLIDDNLIISLVGSFFFGFIIRKRLNDLSKKILFTGFFSCFTSFTGLIYLLYEILHQGDWIKFIIFFNLIIITNLFIMICGFWISRKIT